MRAVLIRENVLRGFKFEADRWSYLFFTILLYVLVLLFFSGCAIEPIGDDYCVNEQKVIENTTHQEKGGLKHTVTQNVMVIKQIKCDFMPGFSDEPAKAPADDHKKI